MDTPSRHSSRQGRYLRYLNDNSLPEPRTTAWRRRRGGPATPLGSTRSSDTSQSIGPGQTSNPSSPASSSPSHSPSQHSPLMCTPSPDNTPPTSRPRTCITQPGSDSEYTQLLTPLYPGADITVCGAMCAIMQFSSSNKLTYAAIGGLLKLVRVLCPTAAALPESLYLFKKFFGAFSQIHTHQRICMTCKSRCDTCSCVSTLNRSTADLVHLDIDPALEAVVARKLYIWRMLYNLLITCSL